LVSNSLHIWLSSLEQKKSAANPWQPADTGEAI